MYHILEIQTKKGRSFVSLEKERYRLGRSSRNCIVIKDPQISRCHATIIRKRNYYINEYCFIIYDGDLNQKKSSNGLIINENAYFSKELEVNDIILLGDNVKMKYYQGSEETLNLLKIAYKDNHSSSVFIDDDSETARASGLSNQLEKRDFGYQEKIIERL